VAGYILGTDRSEIAFRTGARSWKKTLKVEKEKGEIHGENVQKRVNGDSEDEKNADNDADDGDDGGGSGNGGDRGYDDNGQQEEVEDTYENTVRRRVTDLRPDDVLDSRRTQQT